MQALPIELEKAMDFSKSDPNQAAEVLRIAAKYLKNQDEMPYLLALFLADAIDRAMSKASGMRASELLINLNLKSRNRRPASNFEYVGQDLQERLDAKMQKTKASLEVAEKYLIDEKTVKRMHKNYLAFKDWQDEQSALLEQAMVQHYSRSKSD
jgi:hypothetical protein